MLTKSAKEVLNSLITSVINAVEESETESSCCSNVNILKTSFVKCGILPPYKHCFNIKN